jgi:hypothetical protein
MPKGPFLPAQLLPTKFSTTADKAAFGNTLLHFLDAGCARGLFTRKLYNRLSMTFGNIAHYDIRGFYSTWFDSDHHRLAFIENTLRWPCYGDPEFTFSDVERAVQRVVRERNYLGRYRLLAAEALRAAEISELERLEAKYRLPQAYEDSAPATEQPRADALFEPIPPAIPVQRNLF